MEVMTPADPGAQGEGGSIKLELQAITKEYGHVVALHQINLMVRDGEFLTLLGPSGSGKSTLLMIVAGLIPPTDGRVVLDGEDATPIPPHKRGMGVVFQHYALFPHMTVFDNIAFPLRTRYVARAEVATRVSEVLKFVGLPGVGGRYPRHLSGGQQQRIALARALVWRPKVLLMDEPLGALDKKLRVQMQDEIRRMQRALAVTALYVTHDQDEAMSMSDRIAVMRDGRVLQIGPPVELYERPRSRFVATFLGESNIILARVRERGSAVVHVETVVTDDSEMTAEAPGGAWAVTLGQCLDASPGQRVEFVVRPERVLIFDPGQAPLTDNTAPGRIESVVYTGDSVRHRIRLSSGHVLIAKQSNAPGTAAHHVGKEVMVGWHAADLVPLASSPDP